MPRYIPPHERKRQTNQTTSKADPTLSNRPTPSTTSVNSRPSQNQERSSTQGSFNNKKNYNSNNSRNQYNNNSFNSQSSYNRNGPSTSNRGFGSNDQRNNDGFGSRSSSSRFKKMFDENKPSGGYGGRSGGYNNRGGNSYGGRAYGQAAKELSTIPNKKYEEELFGSTQNQNMEQGINFDRYNDIPVEVSGRECPEGIEKFESVALDKRLKENVKLCGYSTPTPIQKFSIPCVMQKRDLMACAQTGSGKTAAFLIPSIHMLLNSKATEPPKDSSRGSYSRSKYYPQALILSPTRELSQQIQAQAKNSYIAQVNVVYACTVVHQ